MKLLYLSCCVGLLGLLVSCNDDTYTPNPPSCAGFELESMPINYFQSIGSHNSYRKRTYTPIYNLFALATTVIPNEWVSDAIDPAIQWDYDHDPLPMQMNRYQVRSLELDLYNDPEGGLFATRLGNALVGEEINANIAALHEPGVKVMHIAHLDYMTHHYTLRHCLETIRTWSDNNPGHFPLFVLLELKDQVFPFDIPGLLYPFNDDNAYLVAEEILNVMPREKLITPADLRTHATLEESIQANGWPTLAESRGKIFFITLSGDGIADVTFGSNGSTTNHAEHVFKVANDPVGLADRIRDFVDQGFMVRTRADAGTIEARTGDVTARDAAFASGAQLISTDYYRPDPRHLLLPQEWTDYDVQWPGNRTARFNLAHECYVD